MFERLEDFTSGEVDEGCRWMAYYFLAWLDVDHLRRCVRDWWPVPGEYMTKQRTVAALLAYDELVRRGHYVERPWIMHRLARLRP